MTEPEDREVIRRYWSEAAPDFDDEPDHGLKDPTVQDAWRERLRQWVPPEATRVVDLGCGTGSISLLLAELGHEVLGVDTSPKMIDLARTKVASAGRSAAFLVGDIEQPLLAPGTYDAVVCRHVVWTLLDPPETLERWAALVAPGGRIVLVEGRWFDPSDAAYPGVTADRLPWNGGISAEMLVAVLEPWFDDVHYVDLSDSPKLWGRDVTDERYAVVAVGPIHQRSQASASG